ncbi:MAG: lysine biosynthesis protein LysX [Patescibacteria group bacterium]|jgi:[lysine-biosynthesis-protein LysW]--L-2-aminoadipate ligase
MPNLIALLHTGIREEERMILEKAKELGVAMEPLDARGVVFGSQNRDSFTKYSLVLQRCVAANKAENVLWYFEEMGIPVVNSLAISELCKNKFATSLRLFEKGVPTPRFALVFNEASALNAVKDLGGFPVVIKPIKGTSWGRLMGKVNDADGLEMILEHKEAMGVNHQSFYLQEYINKPGRDIRIYVAQGEVYAAIYRFAPHWITNTARGATVEVCPITPEIQELGKKIQSAMGNGLLAVDLFESEQGLLVNEVNDNMEFKNVVKITGQDVPKKIIEYCLSVMKS